MSEEKRLIIENDLCMNKSKAQVIKLYLDLMEQYNKEIEEYKEIEKSLNKEINKLTAESTEWEERTYCWQDRAENLQIVLDKIKENTERTIEIIKQQPAEDDTWILERLNSNLKILEEIND